MLDAMVGEGTADLLGSGAFGAGSGVSDNDTKNVKEIVGADKSLTPEGIRQILQWRAKLEVAKINKYDRKLKTFKRPVFGKFNQREESSYQTDWTKVPEQYRPDYKPPKNVSEATGVIIPDSVAKGMSKADRKAFMAAPKADQEAWLRSKQEQL